MHDLMILDPVQPGALTRVEIESVAGYLQNEKAASTRACYAADWKDFDRWCGPRGLDPLPALPGTVAAYLSALADHGRKASTIARRGAAIGYRHRCAGYEPPTNSEGVKATMRGKPTPRSGRTTWDWRRSWPQCRASLCAVQVSTGARVHTTSALAVSATFVLVVLLASGAQADRHDGWHGGHGRGWHHGEHGWHDDDDEDGDRSHAGVVVGAPLFVYAPPPFTPRPVYHPPPPPPLPAAPAFYPAVPNY
jgi:hypothetical protein